MLSPSPAPSRPTYVRMTDSGLPPDMRARISSERKDGLKTSVSTACCQMSIRCGRQWFLLSSFCAGTAIKSQPCSLCTLQACQGVQALHWGAEYCRCKAGSVSPRGNALLQLSDDTTLRHRYLIPPAEGPHHNLSSYSWFQGLRLEIPGSQTGSTCSTWWWKQRRPPPSWSWRGPG